jgi:hypothetical protein
MKPPIIEAARLGANSPLAGAEGECLVRATAMAGRQQ